MLSSQKSLPSLDEELFCVIEEQDHSVHWTDKGLRLLSGAQNDAFIIPDLDEGIEKIETDPDLNFREKKKNVS